MKTSRPRFLLAVLLVVFCVLLSGTGLLAHGPSQLELVMLNVRVTDPSSQAVLDVPQSSFRVLEDGVAQTITMFSKEQIPVSYGLLIDNSGSMRSQLDEVVKASERIVNSNKPSDDAFLVRFISSDKIQVVQDTTSDRDHLINGLEGLYVEGGATAVVDAVYLAVDKLSKQPSSDVSPRRRALVLVTDGEDRNSFYKLEQLLKLLGSSDVQIYTIGFTRELKGKSPEKAKNLLNQLATDTGGRAFFPATTSELQNIADQIINDIRTQYVIGYEPSNRQSGFHKVQVLIEDDNKTEKRVAVTRVGYLARQK
jgi:Ca-activated chloride channel family protein